MFLRQILVGVLLAAGVKAQFGPFAAGGGGGGGGQGFGNAFRMISGLLSKGGGPQSNPFGGGGGNPLAAMMGGGGQGGGGGMDIGKLLQMGMSMMNQGQNQASPGQRRPNLQGRSMGISPNNQADPQNAMMELANACGGQQKFQAMMQRIDSSTRNQIIQAVRNPTGNLGQTKALVRNLCTQGSSNRGMGNNFGSQGNEGSQAKTFGLAEVQDYMRREVAPACGGGQAVQELVGNLNEEQRAAMFRNLQNPGTREAVKNNMIAQCQNRNSHGHAASQISQTVDEGYIQSFPSIHHDSLRKVARDCGSSSTLEEMMNAMDSTQRDRLLRYLSRPSTKSAAEGQLTQKCQSLREAHSVGGAESMGNLGPQQPNSADPVESAVAMVRDRCGTRADMMLNALQSTPGQQAFFESQVSNPAIRDEFIEALTDGC